MARVPVLFVVESHFTGGAEMAWCELIEHLDPSRVEASFICPPYPVFDELVQRAEAAGARCLARTQIEGSFDFRGKREFKQLLQDFRGIVHFNQSGLDACRHQIALARLHRPRLGLVSTVHAMRRPVSPRSAKFWRQKRNIPALHRVVCISEAVASHVTRFVSRERIRIQGPFLTDAKVRQALAFDSSSRTAARAKLGISADALVAALVGIDPVLKGAGDLVPLVPEIVRSVPDFLLLIVGGDPAGNLAPILERAVELDVADAVRWLGPVDDVLDTLAAADALVHAPPAEGLSRVIQEAEIMSLPVVAYRTGGIEEIVRDGETGHLVAAGDAAALAQRLAAVLAEPDRAAALGAAGRAFAEANFTAARAVSNYQAVYDEVFASINR